MTVEKLLCKASSKAFMLTKNASKVICNEGNKLNKGFFKMAKPAKSNPVRAAVQKEIRLLESGIKLQADIPTDMFLREIPKENRKAVAALIGDADTVSIKAKHNEKGEFSILGFIAKKGNKTVGKGAISVTEAGTPNAVAKWHISTGQKGKTLQTNGFVDCAQETVPTKTSVVPSFIKKMLGFDIKSGKSAGAHLQVSPTKATNLVPNGSFSNAEEKVNTVINAIKSIIGV